MTVVEELVSVLGLEIGEGALATLSQFRTAVTRGLAGVGGVVAALGAAFAGTVVSVANLGAEVNTTSLKLGLATDAVQEMKYAAEVTNVSFDSLTTAMKFLSKNAAEGGDASRRIFESLSGVGMRDAQGNLKTVDKLIEDFADKIVATKEPIEQVKLAMLGLHGQSGVEILPLLKLGGAGIRQLREEAEDLGYVLDQNTIKASARFNQSLTRLKYALMGIRNQVGTPFITDFGDALDWMTERVRHSREWFQGLARDIRDLGQRFGRIIGVAKSAFEAVRKFITDNKLDGVADAVHWMDLLEAALIGVATVSAVSAAAFAAEWLIAAAPFILIATLIGLIVDDIAHFLSGGDSVLGMAEKWSKAFNPEDSNLIKFFKQALNLLFDLGDPAKWRRVGEAAKDLFFSGITAAMGLPERPADVEARSRAANPFTWAQLDAERKSQINQLPQDQWNAWAAGQQTPQFRPSRPEDHASDMLPFQERLRAAREAQDAAEQKAADDLPFQKRMRDQMQQTVEIHIHDAKDPSDPAWQKAVLDVVGKANSDAKAAITGGS